MIQRLNEYVYFTIKYINTFELTLQLLKITIPITYSSPLSSATYTRYWPWCDA